MGETITLGDGSHGLAFGTRDGFPAISIFPLDKPQKVGTKIKQKITDEKIDQGLVIKFTNTTSLIALMSILARSGLPAENAIKAVYRWKVHVSPVTAAT